MQHLLMHAMPGVFEEERYHIVQSARRFYSYLSCMFSMSSTVPFISRNSYASMPEIRASVEYGLKELIDMMFKNENTDNRSLYIITNTIQK